MHREHLAWDSPRLSRRMELLWFGHAGRPLLIFLTRRLALLRGRGLLLVNALRPKIEAGELQVCCVDTVNLESWHNKQLPPLMRVARHEQYDAYLRDELVPMIQNRSQRKDLITLWVVVRRVPRDELRLPLPAPREEDHLLLGDL